MQTPEPKIEWRDPSELHPHPATKHLHTLRDDDERFLRIVTSMERRGFDASEPIVVDEKKRIMEGRHRWRAAKRLQLDRVAVIVRPETEVAQIIISSICARKHYSKSAIAFECYPLFESAHNEAIARHEEFLKKGPFSPSDTQRRTGVIAPKYVEDLAGEMGVGVVTFKMAARVHELFRKEPEYAAQMLPRLYGEFDGGEHENTRPVGLGAILAGFSGKTRTEGHSKRQAEQLELFGKAVKSFVFQCTKLEADDEAAKAAVRARLEDLQPEELQRIAALADLVKAEARRALKRAEGEA